MISWNRRALVAVFAALVALVAPASMARDSWGNAVTRSETSHLLGNPQAKVKVVTYISYTCPHCADFARIGDPAMQLAYLPGGKVSYEIRPLIRNQIDLAASLLVRCGPEDQFLGNHTAFFERQPRFLSLIRSASPTQGARWKPLPNYAHLKNIAYDLGLNEVLRDRGYRDSDINACLADARTAAALEKRSESDRLLYGIPGTPSFLIGDRLDGEIYDWQTLEAAIERGLG